MADHSYLVQCPADVTMMDASMLSADAHKDSNAFDRMDISPAIPPANREPGATFASMADPPPPASSGFVPFTSLLHGAPAPQQLPVLGRRFGDRPRRARLPLTAQGPAEVARRATMRVNSVKRKPFKAFSPPRRPSRLSPILSTRVYNYRPGGRNLFTSTTNRTQAFHRATSNLLYPTNGGLAPLNVNAGRLARPAGLDLGLGLNNASSTLPRKRSLDDEDGYASGRARLELRIEPTEVRRQHREWLFGKPSEKQDAPTIASRINPSTPAAVDSMLPIAWSPSDQLLQEVASVNTTQDDYIPGSWPEASPLRVPDDVRDEVLAPTKNETLASGEVPLMSGALPATPTRGNAREVVPISPDGITIPAEYSLEVENTQAQDVAPVQDAQPAGTSNWFGWYGTAVVQAFKGVVEYAGSVKRRAVSYFVRPRPVAAATPRRTVSPRIRNLRGYSEEDRRRLRSDQWRRERGLPTREVEYPFPELDFELPQFPVADSSPRVQNDSLAQPRLTFPFPFLAPAPRVPRKDPKEERKSQKPRKLPAIDTALTSKQVKGKTARVDVEKKRRRKKKTSAKLKEQAAKEDAAHEAVSPLVSDLAPHLTYSPAFLETKEIITEVEKLDLHDEPSVQEEEPPIVDPWVADEQPEFLFGPAVSAVRLFSARQPLPPGRTESIYAAEWREIEQRQRQEETPARVRPSRPAVRPLPDGWETRVSEAMSLPNGRQVATSLSGDPLTKRDLFTCYARNTWLNDEVINAYLALIIDYLRRSAGNAGRHDKPRFHAFNSFFFSNLRDKGYQSVRRWATRAKIGGKDLLNVDTVFIPVHNHQHWTLIVVKPADRTIEHFDSMGSLSQRHVAVVKDWLSNELGSLYAEDEWTVLPSISPQQNNGVDCGVFLLSTAKAIAFGLDPLSYSASDIGTLRKKIVAELINGGFEGDFDPAGSSEELLM